MTLSIVICTLNNYSGLEQCLKSIRSQSRLPEEIVIVHGSNSNGIPELLDKIFNGCSMQKKYIRAERSLVIQRNVGIRESVCDVVMFLDDDVVLTSTYIKEIMFTYEESQELLGGVQGCIIQDILDSLDNKIYKCFSLAHFGEIGVVTPSAWPCFLGSPTVDSYVEVFNGCMMSFRRDILIKYNFDENLHKYWLLDDVELSFRISRNYKLMQTPRALLYHLSSSGSYESEAKLRMMSVANNYYFFKKYYHLGKFSFSSFFWSQFGNLLYTFYRSLKAKSLKGLLGYSRGWRKVILSLKSQDFAQVLK